MNASGSDLPSYLGKVDLLELRWSVAVVFAGGRSAGIGGGGRRELLPEPLDLGLQGLDRCGQRPEEGRKVRGGWLGHRGCSQYDGNGMVGLSGGMVEECLDADTRCYEP